MKRLFDLIITLIACCIAIKLVLISLPSGVSFKEHVLNNFDIIAGSIILLPLLIVGISILLSKLQSRRFNKASNLLIDSYRGVLFVEHEKFEEKEKCEVVYMSEWLKNRPDKTKNNAEDNLW